MPSKQKKAPQLIGMPWEFDLLWNEALHTIPERPLQKRSHIWASEIGRDYCNRYLKMHAHTYSNPYTDRSRRKFSMGHIVEWIVSLVLTICGIMKAKQLRGEVQLKNCLRVTGKLDFIAGGDVDWVHAREEVKRIQHLFQISIDDLPPIILHAVEKILSKMEMMFSRVPLRQYIFECKSIGGKMAERLDAMETPMSNHELQTAHYLIANPEIPEGMVLYISKDDAMCKQFLVELSTRVLKEYRDDVKTMTAYFNSSGRNYLKNMPPRPVEVVYSDTAFKFVKNFELEYSPYLTMLYPEFKDYEAFKWKWEKALFGWNYTFRRCVTGANMTPNNKEKMAEAKKIFPTWDKLVAKAKADGAFQKPEEEEQ